MPVPQADQISLEECIFQKVPNVFHFGRELVIVICTLSESYFLTEDKGITDTMIDNAHMQTHQGWGLGGAW